MRKETKPTRPRDSRLEMRVSLTGASDLVCGGASSSGVVERERERGVADERAVSKMLVSHWCRRRCAVVPAALVLARVWCGW
jgi:hypothetical protein